ncbi:MAG: hypothetical protein ACO3QC_05270 [Phycisphaerales bacterium]
MTPLLSRGASFDLREFLVAALAAELSRRFGGNPVLNRLEAAAHIDRLLMARDASADGSPPRQPRNGSNEKEEPHDATADIDRRSGFVEGRCLPTIDDVDGILSS